MQRILIKETTEKEGKTVLLKGWVDTVRDHGKLVFFELRDRSGKIQIVGDAKTGNVHLEDVISVKGVVKLRPEEMINPTMNTGRIEILAQEIEVLNRSKELPFSIDTDGRDIREDIRLKYRYLDLRRERMQKNLRLRSKFVQACREYLFTDDFVEVETPLLTKSTKEGARDFIVPSRFQPGKFYALPQSPQQYKQLLMTGGIERYFQVAKCIRDEDLRADRGFEFTQLDLEMSFVGQKTVMDTVETMVKKAVWAVGGRLKDENFPVVNYADAMEKYGEDRFDLRSEEEKEEGVLAFAWVVNFPFFKRVDKDDAAEVVDGKSGWTFTHNPFSSPLSEHKEWHEKGERIEEILTAQYDLVCNGYEVGGGSIRAHDPEVLRQTFRIMGYSDAETEESIGHMLMAFELGTPPHGGIALGIDRLIMLLNNEKSLKETIAFPMTATGRTAVMDAPCPVSDQQLKELGIEVRGMSQVAKDHISVFEQIRLYLDKEKIEYSAMEHEPVVTSEDAAKVRGVKLETGAKALVLSADGQPVMAVVSAAHKLDLKKFKKQFDYKDVSMATKELLLEATGLKPGAVPPLGSLFGIKTYVDEELTKVAKIDFSAGSHTQSIEMSSKDYLQVEKPILGEFSK